MKTLRGLLYGVQLFLLATFGDPPPIEQWLRRLFSPPKTCTRCNGTCEEIEDVAECIRCEGNGVEPW